MAHRRPVLSILLGMALLLGSSAVMAAAEDVIEEARSSLQANEPQQAYEILAAREADYAGNTEFDYWLGLVAVRAGEHGHATFALERVIADNPDHAGARLELAAAYVALDQEEEAARQLDELRTLDPPPKAAERIEQLSEAVGRRAKREARQDQLFYVALEGGHDDNVATYPDEFTIFPGLPPITTVDSGFYGLRLGGSKNFSVAPGQKLGITGQLYGRRHDKDDAEPFDQDFGLLRGRWVNDLDGRQEVETGLELSQFRLDGEKYYNLIGLYSTYRVRRNDRLTWDLDLRVRDIAFEVEVNDYTYYSLQPGVQYQLSPRWRVDANLAVELESANEDRLGGDAQIYGLQGKTRYAVSARHVLEAAAQYDRAQYQDEFPIGAAFNPQPEDRDDNRFDATLGWEWFPNEDWRTRLEARYRKQDSSLDLYTYERTVGKFSVTRFF